MFFQALTDIVVVLHFVFILFAILGGLFVLRWHGVAWAHVPVVVYASLIEFLSWTCPLTPLENWLRHRGGSGGYEESFTEHYILPVIYPTALTFQLQVVLGILVVGINAGVYAWVIRKSRRS